MQILKKIIRSFILKVGGEDYLEKKLLLIGKIASKNNSKLKKINDLSDVEFSVFSQWGDDGIINWLTNNLPKIPKNFLEIGTQDYKESNTRFLTMSKNWSGYIIDSSNQDIEKIKKQNIYWKHNLKAFNFFITKENINNILKKIKIPKEIGLLSLDIDGNDYWVWEKIKNISPAIFVCEYNAVFGDLNNISTPYTKNFNRTKYHHSNLAFGASLPAFIKISQKKNYKFIGTNSNGVNAYFIKNKYFKIIDKKIKNKTGFVSLLRESRNQKGEKSYIANEKRIKKIENVKVQDLKKNKIIKIKNIKKFYSSKWKEKFL